MARPQKHNADYFPHNCDLRNDRRCKALRSKFNLEGYAVFVMILEILTNANHFQIENNPMEMELIAGDIDIDAKKLNAILEYLIKLGLLTRQQDLISSPILEDLKNILNDIREKDRNRKKENLLKSEEVFHAENPTKENEVIRTENGVFQSENAQSKVKESKVKERKENKIKEKGIKEIQPPIFLKNILNEIKNNAEQLATENQNENPKEKSSAKKEMIVANALPSCKQLFQKQASHYVWENKDEEQLVMLLQKILITKSNLQSEAELTEAFFSFLQKLPEYWRIKKFTIPNLNFNYNEIVNEIKAGKKNIVKAPVYKPISKPAPEIKKEPTPEEKQKIRADFFKAIAESYQRYITTGEHGFMPLWVMFNALTEEKILKVTEKKMEQYRAMAIEKRKADLSKPQNPSEARTFRNLLENIASGTLPQNEKGHIETSAKSIAVQTFFDELKKKQTDIKTLFKNL